MNDPDHFLARIFALNRRPPDPTPADLPFGLETAILSHWRSASEAGANRAMLPAMRWAAALAFAVVIGVAAFQHDQLAQLTHGRDLETRIADSAVAAAIGYE